MNAVPRLVPALPFFLSRAIHTTLRLSDLAYRRVDIRPGLRLQATPPANARYHTQAIDHRTLDPPLHLFLSQSFRPSAQSPAASPRTHFRTNLSLAEPEGACTTYRRMMEMRFLHIYRVVPRSYAAREQGRLPCIPGMRREEIIWARPPHYTPCLRPRARASGSGQRRQRPPQWCWLWSAIRATLYISAPSTNAHYTLRHRLPCPSSNQDLQLRLPAAAPDCRG
ncbi:hypothetical protein C8F01DRAFT_639553 [Mycena amicta]|nr:hypothetical protein C8F01DRAFT_639553 [Mycena amicta]